MQFDPVKTDRLTYMTQAGANLGPDLTALLWLSTVRRRGEANSIDRYMQHDWAVFGTVLVVVIVSLWLMVWLVESIPTWSASVPGLEISEDVVRAAGHDEVVSVQSVNSMRPPVNRDAPEVEGENRMMVFECGLIGDQRDEFER
jgi:hypothetical protein